MGLQEKLMNLFLLEQQVRGLRARSDSAARRLSAQKVKLKQFTQQRDELAEQLKGAQVKTAQLEGQVKDAEGRINKLREQMNSVKHNKEYAALLIEVSTLKNDKGKVEESALEQMTKVDTLRTELAAAEARVAEQTKLVAGAEKDLSDARGAVAGDLTPLEAQRDQAQAEVPQEALAVFKKQLVNHEGEAMAKVIEESRKHMEYSCGGCFLSIPVEKLNALMVRDEIVCCPSCGRILYVEKELRESFSEK